MKKEKEFSFELEAVTRCDDCHTVIRMKYQRVDDINENNQAFFVAAQSNYEQCKRANMT